MIDDGNFISKGAVFKEGDGMLKRLGAATPDPGLALSQVEFPAPFAMNGLGHSVLSCGGWPLVHMGLLVPEAHLIFICPQNCLRGVVLVAAEMQAAQRFSTVTIEEHNVLEGDMEALTIDGVSDIIDQLPQKPPAVLVFTNCIHHFVGTDLPLVYKTLRQRYPDIAFTDCYMNPILRKKGSNPELTMRKQLYSLLEPQPLDPKSVNIVGNNFAQDPNSDLQQILTENGYTVREVNHCRTYAQYQAMATSALSITTLPVAAQAGELMTTQLGQQHLYLPQSFDYQVIRQNLQHLCQQLSMPEPDYSAKQQLADQALDRTQALLGDTPIAIDATACPGPLALAVLLLQHGFNVTKIYADMLMPTEKAAFEQLKALAPNLRLYPIGQPGMRQSVRQSPEKTLAIGGDAAYYTGTKYFVNLMEGAGLYGFNGVVRLAQLMSLAFHEPKDPAILNQIHNRGEECVL